MKKEKTITEMSEMETLIIRDFNHLVGNKNKKKFNRKVKND